MNRPPRSVLLATALLAAIAPAFGACSSPGRRAGRPPGSTVTAATSAAATTVTSTTSTTAGEAGDVVHEPRPVPPFTRLTALSSANVVVRGGQAVSVTVTAERDVIDKVTTEVRDGTLVIGAGGSYSSQHGVLVEVSVPTLERLLAAGSGNVDASGLSGNSLAVSITGSGNVQAAGRADRLDVDVVGSGNARLFDLPARRVDVTIRGAGNVEVTADEELHASVPGAGTVRYGGHPATVDTGTSGGGHVQPR